MKRQGVEKKREGNKTRTPPSSHRERRERRRLKLQGCQARANAKQSHNCRPAPNPQQQSQPLRRISQISVVSRHFFFFFFAFSSITLHQFLLLRGRRQRNIYLFRLYRARLLSASFFFSYRFQSAEKRRCASFL